MHDLLRSLGNSRALRYVGKKVLLSVINVMAQPRKTFEYIPELALDIAQKGLLSPFVVARFNKKNCEDYIKTVNLLWGTGFTIKEMKSVVERGERIYYVLLAGERRFRSCCLLWESGCMECQNKHEHEKPGKCFRRHFGGDKIEIRCCSNIPSVQALFLQLSENTHMAVPPHEEAQAYANLFKLIREVNPEFSLTAFSRSVGRGPDKIRNAISYCELPDNIRKAVEQKKVSYGVAVEIARIQKEGGSKGDLEWWMIRAIAENVKVSDFKKSIDAFLRERNNGQTLLGIAGEEQIKLERKLHIKKVVERNTINSIWSWLYYWARVKALFDEGFLGKSDSPFSSRSTLRVFRDLMGKLEQVLPHLKELISEHEYKKAEVVLQDTKEAISSLEANIL